MVSHKVRILAHINCFSNQLLQPLSSLDIRVFVAGNATAPSFSTRSVLTVHHDYLL